MDILYFTTRPKNREKMIQSASTKPLVAEYETNRKAEERHPEKQEFVICDIVEHDANVKSYFLKKKDGTNPAFFRAGQYVVVRQKIDGKLIARPISISCGPDFSLDGKYVITVKRAPGGFMSEYILDNWKVGDEVTTSGPQGVFYYERLRDAKERRCGCRRQRYHPHSFHGIRNHGRRRGFQPHRSLWQQNRKGRAFQKGI